VVYGVGTDIVEVGRFERFVREGNISLLERLFTPAEQEYCCARRRSAQHFALRFAAKEAFLKALGTGLREGLSWQHVEVVNDALGKPELKLEGKAAEMASENGINTIHVSLSHDGNYAVAMVVLETSR
jgi:holo-[acyl-carrier protein] synthase